MNIKVLVGFFCLLASNSVFAGIFLVNQDQYLEINFTIEGTNGVYDTDINRLSILPSYGTEYLNSPFAIEEHEFFDGSSLLATAGFLGISADDYDPFSGVDFTSIRDGSLQGKVHLKAWFDGLPNKFVEIGDQFGWSLDICDANGCQIANNSYISFGDIRVVSNEVPEPPILFLFALSVGTILLQRKSLKMKQ